MYTPSEQCPVRDVCVHNGKGLVHIRELTDAQGLYGHGRLFAHITLDPGCSIGEHDHQHETEFYYILQGDAVFSDNGVLRTVHPGDVCATGYGQRHSLENQTAAPVELVALIVTE